MIQINDHLFIVISGDNGNALGVIRSLGEAGIRPVLIYLIEASHIPMLITSRYLHVVHQVHTYEEGVDLLLKNYSGLEKKPFVYTCDDSVESIVDNEYERLIDHFYFFHAGEKGRVNYLMDKKVISDIAVSCGFRVPKSEVVNKGDLPQDIAYPLITKTRKSIMGAWKADSYICQNEKELKDAYEKIASPELKLEEYIDKKNELALEGFSINGGEDVFIPYKVTYIRFSGDSYGYYMHIEYTENDDLIKKVKTILKECRYSGCFEVEFLIDKDDTLWFTEVNFRFSLWNYAVTFGGLNYPMMWAESTLENKVIAPEGSSYARLPLNPFFTALYEPGDFGQSVVKKKVSFKKWLSDVLHADMLYIYNKKDIKPSMSFWTRKFLRKFSGKRKVLI